MIAAFAVALEFEPGGYLIPDGAVDGVHLTLLSADGRSKAGTARDKIMVGPSAGAPISLFPPNDLLGLVITEGIEDALTLYAATGLGAWAAGSASRLPALDRAVPSYIDLVTIGADRDAAGEVNARRLQDRLAARSIPSEIRFPPNASSEAA